MERVDIGELLTGPRSPGSVARLWRSPPVFKLKIYQMVV